MNGTDPYVRVWLSTSFGVQGPDGTRLAGRSTKTAGLSIYPTRRRSAVGEMWKDDRAALLEDPALARLSGVTQVFPVDEQHANRLVHSREVADIAAQIAAALGLDTDLAAAIGLAHDCGHAPFGHAGERELQELKPDHSHAQWGADVVLRGRGYSHELLSGVRSHSWSSASACATPEAEIVRWADRIAYLTRDLADALDVGLLSDEPAAVIAVLGRELADQRECLVHNVVSASVRVSRIAMEESEAVALAKFREFNSHRIYQHARLRRSNAKARSMIRSATQLLRRHCRSWHSVAAELTSMTDADVELLVTGRALDEHEALSCVRVA